jgi:dihydropyrimidinase
MMDLVVRGGTIVTPYGVFQADIGIKGERIVAIGLDLSGQDKIDAFGKLILPGVIDAHTHMAAENYGVASSDDFLSGTRAATCGGVTTIIDFTVGTSETSIPEEIEARKEEAAPSVIDYALHAEVIGWQPGQEKEIEEAREAGVRAFKFYMAYGSLGQRADTGILYHAFRKIEEIDGVAMVHAEDDPIIESLVARLSPEQRATMSAYPGTRPAVCEGAAIEQAIYLAEQTGVRLHVVHVSSALGLEAIRRAQSRSVRVSGETCPQYLLLTEEAYKGVEGPQFSVMPPLRTKADQTSLWSALRDGTLDLVATDHCPFTRKQKTWNGSFLDLPYGLPGVETLLPLLYSEGVRKGRLPLTALPRLLAEGPARVNGIYPRKGSLSIGSDADIVIFDPEKEWRIHAANLCMAIDFSPYEGKQVRGAIETTISRGRIVYANGTFQGKEGGGRFISYERQGNTSLTANSG